MNKIRLKYIAGFAIGALLFGCNDSESDLLETKVYFEENSVTIKASGDDVITHDLQARLSFKSSSPTEVTYEIGGASAVEAFNAAHGTTYELTYSPYFYRFADDEISEIRTFDDRQRR